MKTGKVTQIIGPVVDVDFGEGNALPPIYNALKIKLGEHEIVAEVVKHLEPGKIRAISLSPTDGLNRGAEVYDEGKMIEVPVGEQVLGHIFDVVGRCLDAPEKFPATRSGSEDPSGSRTTGGKKYSPIHRDAPKFTEQST